MSQSSKSRVPQWWLPPPPHWPPMSLTAMVPSNIAYRFTTHSAPSPVRAPSEHAHSPDDWHSMDSMNLRTRIDMDLDMHSLACCANNDVYIQTLVCMSQHCDGVEVPALENFWETLLGGNVEVPPKPK